ncbi:AzlC family ABC transporter permease [Streptomyces sp. NPDC048172]|uniref:AzlC family ABC transporter permease n=1 Tax=Streptomyces sp. NPDC048172 TaxID=3365505 RepID=UPI00371A8D66
MGLGLVPLGLAFGVLITHSGLPWWSATLFTVLVYAGSFEFLLVGLVTATTPLAAIALSAFLVNFRHVFYALSYPMHRLRGRAAKAYGTYALSDEAYALTAGAHAQSWPSARILYLQMFLQMYWIGGATAGALLGSLVPAGVSGMEFAMTALFTVLALDSVRDRRGDLPTPLLALLSALAARLVFPGQMLLAAFALFTAALLAQYLLSKKEPSRA